MTMMKSEKIIRIELRNPTLRQIRKNLRDIVKLAVKDKIRKLMDEEHKLREKDILTPGEELRITELSRKSDRLYHLLSASIIQCSMGAACDLHQKAKKEIEGFDPRDRRTDLDMVWVPEDRKWYCTGCFDSYLS